MMNELTDDELFEIYSLVYDKLFYGDEEVVYGTTEEGKLIQSRLTSIWRKVDNEAKVRGLWWGTA